jgi:hypothetical protein
LPPEVHNDILKETLASFVKCWPYMPRRGPRPIDTPCQMGYGRLWCIWPDICPHLTIAGYRILLSYEGQPATCYGCGEIGHLYQARPARRATETERQDPTKTTYASFSQTQPPPPAEKWWIRTLLRHILLPTASPLTHWRPPAHRRGKQTLVSPNTYPLWQWT